MAITGNHSGPPTMSFADKIEKPQIPLYEPSAEGDKSNRTQNVVKETTCRLIVFLSWET